MYPEAGASGGAIFKPCDNIPRTLVALVPWNKSKFEGNPAVVGEFLLMRK
jgi:hypothetical protein